VSEQHPIDMRIGDGSQLSEVDRVEMAAKLLARHLFEKGPNGGVTSYEFPDVNINGQPIGSFSILIGRTVEQ
jgi:hypothetical protein